MVSPREVIVIGAGVVGCAVAYELARRGASVEVLDDRRVGMGSTQAGAGILAPYTEAREGGALLELTRRGLDAFDGFLATLTAETETVLTYRRTGTLEVALSDLAFQRLSASHARIAKDGASSELLDASAVRSIEPGLSDRVTGGLLIPTHGLVGALAMTRALSAAAERHGARIVESGRIRRIRRSGDDLTVVAEEESRSARTVVVAAGSWSGQIEIEGTHARVPVRPIRGQLLHLGWKGQFPQRVVFGEHCYLVPWDDGTVLVGATVEDVGFDERITVAGVRELLNAVCELVPDAAASSIVEARAGLRPGTPDGLPIIGASQVVPNLVYATGHYRSGILLAPITAQLVADAILDHRIDPILEHTAPSRFGSL